MTKIYVCSPLRGDIDGNIARAAEYCRQVSGLGYLPIAPHVYLTRFLDDTVPAERAVGLQSGLEPLKLCEQLWAFPLDNPTEGMEGEIRLADELGIPVCDGFKMLKLWSIRAHWERRIRSGEEPGPANTVEVEI